MNIRPVDSPAQNLSVSTQAVAALPAQSTSSAAGQLETANPVRQSVAVPSLEQVRSAVKEINKTMESMAPGLEFSIDDDLHETVVKVVDRKTREVLRQIPNQETLEIAKALDKIQGLLIKQEA